MIVPDVLVQSHSASLCMTFYTGTSFPKEYRLDAFAAEHGSWNRARRTGYKVIRIPMKDGKATGEYEDFLVGFVTKEGNVWGRPVGVTVAKDGALLVTDDGSNIIWRSQRRSGEVGRDRSRSPGRLVFRPPGGRFDVSGSQPAEVERDDANAVLQAQLLDHLFTRRHRQAPPRRDADSREHPRASSLPLSVPSAATPLSSNGEALSIRNR